MALDSYKPLENTNFNESWPLAKFYFRVMIDTLPEIGFQTVEGLESEISVMEYRPGNQRAFYKSKRPGMISYSNITLKKGMFKSHKDLYDWYKEMAQAHNYRNQARAITIELLDEANEVMMTWRVSNAIVVKYTPTPLDAEADSEVAVEEMELAVDYWELEIA
jgi:phage tail-like protein